MECLVEFIDKEVVVSEKEFIKFFKMNPFWEFGFLDRDCYLILTTDKKLTLINRYYLFMKSNSSVRGTFY